MRRFVALLAIVAGSLIPAGAAGAATGDLVADRYIPDSTGGVSVAFDGTKLYYTNFNGTILHSINTDGVTGHVDVPIVGAPGVNAFSWDRSRSKFWATGSDGLSIYLLDTTGTATLQFVINPVTQLPGNCDNGFGCLTLIDGFAYDGADDSLWYSPDASQRVYHFSTAGALLGFFDVNDPPNDMADECGFNYSSGVGVGGETMWLGADGCPFFFEYTKTGIELNHFAYDGERAEDFECDNLTFAVNVMWARDAFDGHIRAYEIPQGSCLFGGGGEENHGRMTGGGSVFTATGTRVTHGFELHCTPSDGPNNLEVNWGKGNRFHLTTLESATCTDNPAISPNPPNANFDTYKGSGTGTYNGQAGATADWTFTDAGEPGKNDTATITIKDASNTVVLVVTGTLKSGNHQAHDG